MTRQDPQVPRVTRRRGEKAVQINGGARSRGTSTRVQG